MVSSAAVRGSAARRLRNEHASRASRQGVEFDCLLCVRIV